MKRIIVVLCFLLVSSVGPGGGAERGRLRVEWPSKGFRDLQAAVDAAPDGALLEIKEGSYRINEPIYVRGKRLVIAGSGSGARGGRLTHLVGPPPRAVVDESGNLVLRAETVEGLWNLVGAEVSIHDLKLSGFDAGIVSRDGDDGGSGPLSLYDVVIADTGRGVLSLSSSDLKIEDCTIQKTQWNGISFGPRILDLGSLPTLSAKSVTIIDPSGAGIYFEHTLAFIDDAVVLSAATGGIVGFSSSSFILNSDLLGNSKGGILLQVGFSQIESNTILGTTALQPGDFLGDGISLWASSSTQETIQAEVFDNLIQTADRAGISVFGGIANVGDNQIFCVNFDVFAAAYAGFDFDLIDAGGNECGCGTLTLCAPKGEGLEPPPPVGGLE